LLYIGLYWSHDSSYGFGKLTRVNSSYFFILIYFQLHSLILSLLEIEFYNLFWFFFLWSYYDLMTPHADKQVNLSWSKLIQYIFVSIFIKNISHISYLFWIKLYFYWLYRLFLDLSSQPIHIESINIYIFFFILKTFKYIFLRKI
jgi:hypothetical protein